MDRFTGTPNYCNAEYGNENCINCFKNDNCEAYKKYMIEEHFEKWANDKLDTIDTLLPDNINSKYAKSGLEKIIKIANELIKELS